MIRFSLIFFTLFLTPFLAYAQFEGEIHSKITTRDGNGVSKLSLSKLGARHEIDIRSPKLQQISSRPYHLTTIHKFADPDRVYYVNDERKIYSVINLKKVRDHTQRVDDEVYTVKRIGSDTIAGYTCERVLLTTQNQTETGTCIAKNIAGVDLWITLMEQTVQMKSGMFKALKDAGVEGFPVKMVMRRNGGESPFLTTEMIRAETKSLPAALFDVPPSYQKEDVISSFVTPEMTEKMQGFIRKITPERKKMYEELRNRLLSR